MLVSETQEPYLQLPIGRPQLCNVLSCGGGHMCFSLLTRAFQEGIALPASRTTYLASCAAFFGQNECLELLSRYGLLLDGKVSASAATGGHVSCLRFVRELGDSWTQWPAVMAVWGGMCDSPCHPVVRVMSTQDLII
jgi:hypothetical protein